MSVRVCMRMCVYARTCVCVCAWWRPTWVSALDEMETVIGECVRVSACGCGCGCGCGCAWWRQAWVSALDEGGDCLCRVCMCVHVCVR